MQYLIHDLLKLPLAERLIIVEKLICTFAHTDYEKTLLDKIEAKLNSSTTQ